MKSIFVGSLLLFLSVSSMATDVGQEQQAGEQGRIKLSYEAFVKILMMDMPNLAEVQTMARDLYELGQDKNFVNSVYLSSSDFDALRPMATKVVEDQLLEAAAKCVFMAKGPNGMHIDHDTQAELARRLVRRIYPLTAYRIESNEMSLDGSGAFKAPCILAVERPATSQVLLMQSTAMD